MKMKNAADIMTVNVITAKKDMLLTDVMRLLLRWSISGLPVVDDENYLVGIISEIDLVNMAFDGNAADTTVEEVMSTDMVAFPPDVDMAELIKTFSLKRLRRVPIVDKGKVVGIISRRDILREMLSQYERY